MRGVTMVEVLVAILILTIGLLGTAGLQSIMQTTQVESYQRAQAIVLLQDMVDRLNANRKGVASYVAADLGLSAQNCTLATTVAAKDLCEWNNALFGAAEIRGAQTLGAMTGARGCITNPVATMPREVVVAVVWQGLRATVVPGGTNCGENEYGADDRHRRALVARITIGCLQNDPTSGTCVTP
jgi:type IV pilus assembly protein PilV